MAVLGHRLGICLHQEAIPGDGEDRSHEVTTLETLLDSLLHPGRLTGRIWTMDALHTHRKNAEVIVQGGGDSVMPVKENQPTLLADIRLVFDSPLLEETKDAAET